MLTNSQVDNLRPFTEKYKPFVSLYESAEPDAPELRTEKIKKRQSVFSYVNIHGRALLLQKKKYTWIDSSERDPKTKKVTKFVEVTLKVENLGGYSFDDPYEVNEFERIAFIENWPSKQTIEMMISLPEKLQDEMDIATQRQTELEQEHRDMEVKVKAVTTNYTKIYDAYEYVRTEITALAVEVPALKGTPFEPKYFKDLVPFMTNVCSLHFPNVNGNIWEQVKKT